MALKLDDIQGNILRGYGYAHAMYLFFEVPDADSGRRFLGELADGVQNAAEWEPGQEPETTTNVAVTYAGLRALGVADAILDELPPAFCEPIRERAARLLDDTGPSAPEHWDDGLGTERSHILVMVNGRKGCDQAFETETSNAGMCAQRHGLALVHRQPAAELDNRREHFGWADGFGQPAIKGAPWTYKAGHGEPQPDGKWRPLEPGEFVLGYRDEDTQAGSGPSAGMLHNGTFMVYRKLYQNVAAFRTQLWEDAQQYGRSLPDDPPLDSDQLYELMAAKVAGRWRDGKPISEDEQRRIDSESRWLGDRALPDPSNNFRYYPDDRSGFKCPLGAHIRRTNPRDAIGWHGDGRMSLRHRIIRRGMPYGPFMPVRRGQENDGLKDDGRDRGLIFICFNASLDRQFEVIQRQWCNDGNAFRLGNDKDYLLGDPTWVPPVPPGSPPIPLPDGRVSTGRVTIQGAPPHYVQAHEPFVLTRGCEYLFMPGVESLRGLASGQWAAHGETWPPDETAAIESVVSLARAQLERDYPPTIRPVRRDQHAKAHGCVRAEFVVAADVPATLRHGILRQPGTYSAWIRFSSSAGTPTPPPDSKRDAHGMAIKVVGVGGAKVLASERDATTQDFVLANSRVFFCRNASEYVELASRSSEGKFLRFFFGWNPARWRLREFVNMVLATQRTVRNPLQIRYWSQTPSALGPHVVKYSAKPHSDAKDSRHASPGRDYLEDAMKRTLSTAECHYDFMVQIQTDPRRMPVEDPTINWKERRSPFRTVATIRIPSQDFTSEAQKAFAENLSFTPWHTLPEHRPMGGINRVRKAVYEVISELRHEMNGVTRREPAGDEQR